MAESRYVIVRRHSTPAQKDLAARILRGVGVENGSYDIAHDLLHRTRSIDPPPVSMEEIVDVLREAQFLLNRLNDFELAGDNMTADGIREWSGHISPPACRLAAALSRMEFSRLLERDESSLSEGKQ